MRVTIVREDNVVLVDSVLHSVDCSSLPADFHALQWDGKHGEVEYTAKKCDHCGVRSKKGNELITDLAPYQKYVDAWDVAKVSAEKAAAEREAAEAHAATLAAKEAAEREALTAQGGKEADVAGPQG